MKIKETYLASGGFMPMLDAGHAGMSMGSYGTPGKRSPDWDKGVYYEGMGNRWFVNDIIKELDLRKIPYATVHDIYDDTSLSNRVKNANGIFKKNPKAYLLSIHSNAGGGTGFEGFTSVNETMSDVIIEKFLQALKDDFPEMKLRSDTVDGDLDKEAQFTVLTDTHCPAMLLEFLFMDNKKDYDLLWDMSFRKRIVDSTVCVIEKLYRGN